MKITVAELQKQFAKVKKRGWLSFFEDAGAQFDLPPALLIAIGSRETNLMNIKGDFRGEVYHGYGIMQVDIGTAADWIKTGAWAEPAESILKGAEILKEKVRQAYNALPDASDEEKMRVATASYNSGVHAIQDFKVSGDPDRRTTGHDYSRDVWERKELIERWLAEDGETSEPRDTQPLPPAAETVATETVTKTTAQPATETEPAVVEQSIVRRITASDQVKEIAQSGVTSIGSKVSGGLASGGLLAAIDSFVTEHWAGLIFASALILLAVVVVLFILWHKHEQQKLVAQINSDPSRHDVRL